MHSLRLHLSGWRQLENNHSWVGGFHFIFTISNLVCALNAVWPPLPHSLRWLSHRSSSLLDRPHLPICPNKPQLMTLSHMWVLKHKPPNESPLMLPPPSLHTTLPTSVPMLPFPLLLNWRMSLFFSQCQLSPFRLWYHPFSSPRILLLQAFTLFLNHQSLHLSRTVLACWWKSSVLKKTNRNHLPPLYSPLTRSHSPASLCSKAA